MEQVPSLKEAPQFSSPEEELSFLRERIAQKEKEVEASGQTADREQIVSAEIHEYRKAPAHEVLHPSYQLSQQETNEIVLNLSPEEHDKKIEELLVMLQSKGLKNVLVILERMGNSHLDDDFHRFLVQYLVSGFVVAGLKEKSPLSRSLHMTLYEIALAETLGKEEQQKALKELISSMEQFYAGMLSVSDTKHYGRDYFTLEIAVSNITQQIIFYAAIPNHKKDLFEKQITSIFPDAKIKESSDDYNIFTEGGSSAASYAKYAKEGIFPLKTYDTFDYDPLNVLLNTFSKIENTGEGAAVQLIFNPMGDHYYKKYSKALEEVQKGTPLKKAIDMPQSFFGEMFKTTKDIFSESKKAKDGKKEDQVDQIAVDNIRKKIASPIVGCNIRLIASAAVRERAEKILADIESAFNQFEDPQSNKIKFERIKPPRLPAHLREYSYRIYSTKQNIPMNIKELTTLFHLPASNMKSSPQLKQSRAAIAAAPLDLPLKGTLLGVNRFRTVETMVRVAREDRLRHFYTIGQTGTGKSTLLKNMVVQDIINGDGVCMIDPHGVDIIDVLSAVPKERYDDIIYFDPSYTLRPMGLNMLEYDTRYPEQKTFVVNELLSIFNKLFDMKVAGGPAFEQYFRNSALLVMEHPESGNTLLEISRVMADKKFRDLKLSYCKNPLITQFWQNAEKTTGEASLANYIPYITNKFDGFLSNDIMRPVVLQEHSSFNFRQVMDEKKILLVNLAKGRLGDINSHLIGLILVGKILMAALSRVDAIGKDNPDFYLYIDEFQNVTTDSIASILAEARKYKLSLNIAHQYIAQLEDKIKDAVFGNVGSIAAFRVGPEDAEYLQKQFEPTFMSNDIMNLDNRNAYVKLLVNGRPAKPFNIETLPPPKGAPAEVVEQLKSLSYLKYGKDKREIEEDINKKYEAQKPQVAVPRVVV